MTSRGHSETSSGPSETYSTLRPGTGPCETGLGSSGLGPYETGFGSSGLGPYETGFGSSGLGTYETGPGPSETCLDPLKPVLVRLSKTCLRPSRISPGPLKIGSDLMLLKNSSRAF